MKTPLKRLLFCLDFPLFISPFILLFIVVLFSCTTGKKQDDGNYSYIYLDSLTRKNIIEDNLEKCRFVKLQTTNDCLIKCIQKIEFDDQKFFIKDVNEKVFVFDENGLFLNQIGAVGNGPDEFLKLYDFYLDKGKKQVCILDLYQSTLLKYSYEGKFQGKEKFEDGVFANTSSITHLSNDQLLLIQDNSSSSLFNYRTVDVENRKWENSLPYIVTGETSVAFGESKTSRMNGITYMLAFLSDTIYTYDQNKDIVPRWIFIGENKPVKASDFTDDYYEIALDAFPIIKKKNLSTGITQLYSTDRHIHFKFSMNNSNYRVFYDVDTNSGYYFKIVPTGILTSFSNLVGTSDQAFICVLPIEEIGEEELKENESLRIIMSETKEDDNPIIIKYIFE